MAEAFPISGNIDPSTFPFLLADLHRQGATGSLKVEGPSYPKALYFRGGRVLFGSSNDPKDQLGSILIESGKINQEQLDDVNTKVGPGNPLAKVLAESGYVNQRELSDAARVKVERILSDVIVLHHGQLRVRGRGPAQGRRRPQALDREARARRGGPPDRPRLRAAAPREPRRRPGSDRRDERAHRGAAAGVRASCRSASTASARSRTPPRSTRLDEFEAAKIACALLFLGLLRKAEPSAPTAAAGDELDLAQTARMAFDPTGKAPEAEVEAEPAFFVPEAETGGRRGPRHHDARHAGSPRFPDAETPPLGMNLPAAPLPFSPASLLQPEPQPEPEPKRTRCRLSWASARRRRSPEASPSASRADAPDSAYRLGPPDTAALDRLPHRRRHTRATAAVRAPRLRSLGDASSAAAGVRGRAGPRAGGARASEQGGSGRPRRPAESFRVDALDLRSPCAAEGRALGTSVPFGTVAAPAAGPRPNRRPRGGFPVVPVAAGAGLPPRAAGRRLVLLQPTRSTAPASGSGHAADRPDHRRFRRPLRRARCRPTRPRRAPRPPARHVGTALAADARGHRHGNSSPTPTPVAVPIPKTRTEGSGRRGRPGGSAPAPRAPGLCRGGPRPSRRACGRTPTLASASSSSWPARTRRSGRPWRTRAGRSCSSCPSTTRARAAIGSAGGSTTAKAGPPRPWARCPSTSERAAPSPRFLPTAGSASLIA